MALKVLLVDHSADWLETAKATLESKMYEVETAQNGKKAQLLIYNAPQSFFAVVINLNVKNHSGLEVLKFIKANHVGQRVVVILPDNSKLESGELTVDKLVKMGATEVVIWPFENEHLAEILEGHQSLNDIVQNLPVNVGVSGEVEVSQKDSDFTKIKISEFYSAKAVLFDIYIRLSTDKYVKILHCGDNFSKERIDKYKNEKKVEFLYFHNTDRKRYIQYLNFLMSKLMASDRLSGQSKISLFKTAAEKFVEEAFAVGLKPQVVDEGKQLAENIYNMVEGQKDLYKVLREFEDFDPTACSHSYAVTIFATAIIRQFEWQSKTMIETAALACLFHDIGKMKYPSKELIDKRPSQMTPEELAIYHKHPEFGAEILDSNLSVNQSVKQIILQHHEYFDGTGFPYGIKGNKVLSLSNILSLADDFVHLVAEQKIKPIEALRILLSDREMCKRYSSNILENFMRIFADPEKIIKSFILPTNSRVVPNKKAS